MGFISKTLSAASICALAFLAATPSFALSCKASAVTVALRTKSNGYVPAKQQVVAKWARTVRENNAFGYGDWGFAKNRILRCVKSGTSEFTVLCTARAIPCLAAIAIE